MGTGIACCDGMRRMERLADDDEIRCVARLSGRPGSANGSQTISAPTTKLAFRRLVDYREGTLFTRIPHVSDLQPNLFGETSAATVTPAAPPATASRFAEVVFDRPLDHAYTYGVPDHLL